MGKISNFNMYFFLYKMRIQTDQLGNTNIESDILELNYIVWYLLYNVDLIKQTSKLWSHHVNLCIYLYMCS